MVTDLQTGEQIADSSRPGGSGPLVQVGNHTENGLTASYRLPGTDLRIWRAADSDQLHVRVRLADTLNSLPGLHSLPVVRSLPGISALPTGQQSPWLEADVTLEAGTMPGLTAISDIDPADGGSATMTAKTAAQAAWGNIRVHSGHRVHTFSLDGGLGGYDYTNGFLPRHTMWRWAYTTGRLADDRSFGLNLVSGFTGIGDRTGENAVWLDGVLHPMPSAIRVIWDAQDPQATALVRSTDGTVHLHFTPIAHHHEHLNLGILRSRFTQPTGHFHGHVEVDGQRCTWTDYRACSRTRTASGKAGSGAHLASLNCASKITPV